MLFATAAACRVWAPTTDMDAAAAEQFVKDVNETLGRLDVAEEQTGWIAATYITTDTEAVAARASQASLEARSRFAKEAVKFDAVTVPTPVRRQLMLLKSGLELAAPSDPKAAEELTRLAAKMEGDYGRARWCEDSVEARFVHGRRGDHGSPGARTGSRQRCARRGRAGTPRRRRCAATTRAS